MLLVVKYYDSDTIIVDQVQNFDHDDIRNKLSTYSEFDFPEKHIEENQKYEFYNIDDIANIDRDKVKNENEAAGYFIITHKAVSIEGSIIE